MSELKISQAGSVQFQCSRMPPPERPRLLIIAGPNGSGKSTLYSRTDIEVLDGSVWIINPDELATRIRRQEELALPRRPKRNCRRCRSTE